VLCWSCCRRACSERGAPPAGGGWEAELEELELALALALKLEELALEPELDASDGGGRRATL